SKHSSKFIATRLGDGGKRVILELVVRPQPETEKKPKKAKAAKVKQTAEAAKK
ncbi:MAG: hypothetical protein HY762_00650, partial [Planctomycetes bacterium]|nr:hypothetical protein [Planctomycetota bacterium]